MSLEYKCDICHTIIGRRVGNITVTYTQLNKTTKFSPVIKLGPDLISDNNLDICDRCFENILQDCLVDFREKRLTYVGRD